MLNVLVAWPYWRDDIAKELEACGDDVRVLIDSGAFTAWRTGKHVDLNEYIAFLKDCPVKPWGYLNLDVIGEPEPTQRNFKTIQDAGLSPIPIFTRGQDFDDLADLYDQSERVALGGLVGTPHNMGYVKRFMREAAGRKVHLLGVGTPKVVYAVRPHSADVSNFKRSRQWGICELYLGRGKWERIHRQRKKAPTVAAKRQLKRLGYDWTDLQRDETYRGGKAITWLMSMGSWVHYAVDTERNSHLGTKVFQAGITSATDVRDLRQSYERLKEANLV